MPTLDQHRETHAVKRQNVELAWMPDQFPDVSCPRCQHLSQLFTVPLALIPPSADEAWQALCGECFRQVLEREPWPELGVRPVQHGRSRR